MSLIERFYVWCFTHLYRRAQAHGWRPVDLVPTDWGGCRSTFMRFPDTVSGEAREPLLATLRALRAAGVL